MFSFIKKIRNKDNTPKKGEVSGAEVTNRNNQGIEGVDKKKTDVSCDGSTQTVKEKEHKKTHVTYDGVAVPEIHFKNKE